MYTLKRNLKECTIPSDSGSTDDYPQFLRTVVYPGTNLTTRPIPQDDWGMVMIFAAAGAIGILLIGLFLRKRTA
ncbi:MAG: hypothetical protein RTU30_15720 [Candidatus Thorarchaeota archaeon]